MTPELPSTEPRLFQFPQNAQIEGDARRRTVMFVIGSLDIGGAERHLALITPGLMRLGWHPVIYCLTGRGKQADDVARAGVEVIGPPFEAAGRLPIRIASLALSCAKLFGLMLRRRPRIAHFFLPMAYMIGGPLAIAARIPLRVMSRRSLNLYQRNHPLLRRVELALHRRMTAVLGNSQAVVRDLVAECCDPRRLGLIYNGIEFDVATDSVRESQGDAPLTLIIVANLIPYKGHADLLRALGSIAPAMPPGWRLLCVGRDQGIGPSLRELAGELGIADRVVLTGERKDVPDLIASADIGLLCSHEEGFSNAILEYMAQGLPTVATDVGGNSEAVADGETGFVVPPRSPQALGQAILKLACDASLRQQMGAAARARVIERFSLESCVARYDAFYRALPNGIPPDESRLVND